MILGDDASTLETFVWILNHVLVHIRPKSMKLGQMTNLNVIFHIGGQFIDRYNSKLAPVHR